MIGFEELVNITGNLGYTLGVEIDDVRKECEARGIDWEGYERWVREMSATVHVSSALLGMGRVHAIGTALETGFQVGYAVGVLADVS